MGGHMGLPIREPLMRVPLMGMGKLDPLCDQIALLQCFIHT